MSAFWLNLGLPGLFLAAFLGATLLPLSSEGVLLAALFAGAAPGPALAVASVGNCLGALTNVALGRIFAPRVRARLEASPSGRRALEWAERFGPWALLASPLPILGDPALLAAGLFRVPMGYVVVLGLGLRVLRYVLLALPFL